MNRPNPNNDKMSPEIILIPKNSLEVIRVITNQ
jgi:hypothetical protein